MSHSPPPHAFLPFSINPTQRRPEMAILPFPAAGRPCPSVCVFAPSVNILGEVACCPDVDQTHLLHLSVELFPQQKPFHTRAFRQCQLHAMLLLKWRPQRRGHNTTSGTHFSQLWRSRGDCTCSFEFQSVISGWTAFERHFYKFMVQNSWGQLVIWLLSREQKWCKTKKEMRVVVTRTKERKVHLWRYSSFLL